MKRYGSYFHEVSANNIQTCFTFVPTDRLAASDKSTNVQTAIRVVIGWMSIMRHPPTGLGAIRSSYSTIIGFKLTISRRKIKLSCLKLHPY